MFRDWAQNEGSLEYDTLPKTRQQSLLMNPYTVQYNTAVIRELLITAFSDSELTTLCFDYFHVVYEDFSSGMSKGDKVQRLLEYAVRHNALPELLVRVEQENPTKYVEFASRLTRDV